MIPFMFIWLYLPLAVSIKLLFGQQQTLFTNIDISAECNSVLERNLSCPTGANFMPRPDYVLDWTPESLSSFCESECQNELAESSRDIQTSCQQEVLRLHPGELTLSDYGQFVGYRASHLCLRENEDDENGDDGDFCLLASTSWDVAKLHTDAAATWPEHTQKCLSNEGGRCVQPDRTYIWDDDNPDPHDWDYPDDKLSGLDFMRNRTAAFAAAKRHSLGWETRLELDEFPLEIQCQRCFWKPWTTALESRWGHLAWDEWTASIWHNIVSNCNITGEDATVTPWRNLTAEYVADQDDDDYYDEPHWEPNWDICPFTITVPDDNTLRIKDLAASQNLSTACLGSFNKDFPRSEHEMRGRKLCVPRTCEVERVDMMINVGDFVKERSDRMSMQQFLRWNPCLSRGGHIFRSDTVCVGPHKGRYVPAVVSLDEGL